MSGLKLQDQVLSHILYPVCTVLLEQDTEGQHWKAFSYASVFSQPLRLQTHPASHVDLTWQENHDSGADPGENMGLRYFRSFYLFVWRGKHEFGLPILYTSRAQANSFPKILIIDSSSPYTSTGVTNSTLTVCFLLQRCFGSGCSGAQEELVRSLPCTGNT